MASIVSRGNKYSVVYYEGEGAAKHQVWKSGLSLDEAEALKVRKNLEAEHQREEAQARKSRSAAISVQDFLEGFVKSYGSKHWGSSYYTSNIAMFNNYVYPYFGHHKLVDVTAKDIDDYYDFLLNECEPVHNCGQPKREKVTASQVNDIHKVLRTAFNRAKRWKQISENPFLDADVPEHKSKERPAFSPDEFEKILTYTDHPDDYDTYVMHVALCIQYYCTTRGGEVGAIQWSDYNRDAKTIHIYKAIGRVKREHMNLPKLKIYYKFPPLNANATTFLVLKNPKTEKTERLGKINNLLVEKLDHLRAMQQSLVENIYGDYYPESQLIICQSNGRPLMPEQLNRKFKQIIVEMRDAGFKFESVPDGQIDEVVFHSIRAASCTKKLIISGGNIKAVMDAGGWAEPDMVIRYSKAYEKDQKDMVQQMEDDYLNGSVKGGTRDQLEQPRTDYNPLPIDKNQLLQLIAENPGLLQELLVASVR